MLLQPVRVAGSVLFVAGTLMFFICAGQVYYHKFTGKGVALGGLYCWIRHPQYLGLGVTGIGLAILWPRFLVVALWAVMVALYYLLARDEERRSAGPVRDGVPAVHGPHRNVSPTGDGDGPPEACCPLGTPRCGRC